MIFRQTVFLVKISRYQQQLCGVNLYRVLDSRIDFLLHGQYNTIPEAVLRIQSLTVTLLAPSAIGVKESTTRAFSKQVTDAIGLKIRKPWCCHSVNCFNDIALVFNENPTKYLNIVAHLI